jgi:phosphatidylglycerol:prolipoprotein diacylglycerol transferase
MLPYLEIGPIHLGPFRIFPFALLLGTALLVGHFLIVRRAARTGLNSTRAAEMHLSAIALGFPVAALFKFVYHLEILELDWWTVLTRHLAISSFGGLFGGLGGIALFLRMRGLRGEEAWRYADLAAFAFPFAWIFGRMGCVIVHDHPGIRSSNWLTVAYPGGARYDLAVIEVIFVALMAALFFALDRAKRPAGLFLALLLCLYGPFRIWLDTFHVDPPTYFGWPVDRWAGVVILIAGCAAARSIKPLSRRDGLPSRATPEQGLV